MTGWILLHALSTLFWLWVLLWGGAEWLEGTLASAFVIAWIAPTWSADGIKLFALLMLLIGGIHFMLGLFMPDWRCTLGVC